MSSIVLTAPVRHNLLSLQSTAELPSTTQSRLATGCEQPAGDDLDGRRDHDHHVERRGFISKNLIIVLQTGSSNLTLADTNEEVANSQALATRQSIAVSALALPTSRSRPCFSSCADRADSRPT